MCQYDVSVPLCFRFVFTEQFDHSIIHCIKKRMNRSQDRYVCWNKMLVRRMRSLKPNAHKNDVRFYKNDSRNYLKMLPKWLGMLS